jgi:L-methionine (R)-S-oxide reductase
MSASQNHSQSKLSQRELLQEAEAILTGRWITDLANISSLLMSQVPDINWVGFYLVEPDDSSTMWLGPFQGLPACTMIPFSKGVCGAAATSQKNMRVDDVDAFPGHIVCDSRSKSEVVIPMIQNKKVIGVLDIDSAMTARFSADDVLFFEKVVQLLLSNKKATS